MKGGAEEHIGVKDGKLNINTATVEQLMALSGIGESKAKSIVEDRAKNGLFLRLRISRGCPASVKRCLIK